MQIQLFLDVMHKQTPAAQSADHFINTSTIIGSRRHLSSAAGARARLSQAT